MTDELMLRVATLKVISEYTAEQYKAVREQAAADLGPGDRRMVRSPMGNHKLGSVYMTDPKPTATITDREALTDWYGQHYPELIVDGYEVAASDKELIDLLWVHAPHLLRKRRQIKAEALSDLRKGCAAMGVVVGPGGEADVPGVEVSTADGVVTCRPDDGALLAVMELVGAQRIALDGTLRPELPAGEAVNG